MPGAKAAPADLAALAAWSPARFGALDDAPAPKGLKTFGDVAAALKGFDPGAAAVDRRFALELAPGAETLASDGAGRPLLVAAAHGRGRVVVSAAPFDIDWSNLAAKPFFAAYVEAALEAALAPAAASEGSYAARVGESLTWAWGESEAAPGRVWVRAPDGRRTAVEVRGRRATYGAAEEPGLYEFAAESGGSRRVFAVNLDRSRGESELSAHADPPWAAYGPDALESGFIAEVYGEDRKEWMLLVAALLLALEMLLALPTAAYRKKSPARVAVAAAALLVFLSVGASAQQGDRFIWTQWKHGADWDPYPDAADELVAWLGQITSVRTAPRRRALSLSDPALSSSPSCI